MNREIENITTTLVHGKTFENEKGDIITSNPNKVKIEYKEGKKLEDRIFELEVLLKACLMRIEYYEEQEEEMIIALLMEQELK